MTTDKTATERMRRWRARQRATVTGSNTTIDTDYDYLRRKGLLLAVAFHRAWVEFSYTDRFRAAFKRVVFESWQHGIGVKDHTELDFGVGALRHDNGVLYVGVELKNWFAPQRLDWKRAWDKIGKKFLLSEIMANVQAELDYHPSDTLVKLVICTDAVQFTERGYDLLTVAGLRIERVHNVPFPERPGSKLQERDNLPLSLWHTVENMVVAQIVRILERVFYGE